jgi:hypothetical protein
VIHAYDPGDDGVIEVTADEVDGALEVVVRDYGHGFRPRLAPEKQTASLRLGLPLIAALTSGFELSTDAEGGTTVRLRVAVETDTSEPDAEAEGPAGAEPGYSVLSVSDDDLAGIIVSRVIASIAARAEMSVDRLSDALLLSDAISSGGGQRFRAGRTRLAVSQRDGAVAMRVGPLEEGGGDRLLASLEIPTLHASLAKLADDATVEHDEAGEHLVLTITGGRAASVS